MQKSTLPQGVRKLKAWAEKGALAFDLPIQRASGQWSLLQKSLLIHSMLAEYPIPPLYFIKCRTEEGAPASLRSLTGDMPYMPARRQSPLTVSPLTLRT